MFTALLDWLCSYVSVLVFDYVWRALPVFLAVLCCVYFWCLVCLVDFCLAVFVRFICLVGCVVVWCCCLTLGGRFADCSIACIGLVDMCLGWWFDYLLRAEIICGG